MEAPKILVVDDESRMRKLVKDFLEKKNFHVLEAGDGEEAMDIFYEEKDIALLILDVMMPKMDGWEVCREIRKNSKVPIIMLTARGDERDELLGFDLGVDEYISKPFSPKILVARVEAILRRTGQDAGNDVLSAGGIVIDKSAHQASVDGKPMELSFKEFELLTYFLENQGIALSREKILNSVWNYDYFGDARTIDTHVKKLRSKMGEKGEYIKTVWDKMTTSRIMQLVVIALLPATLFGIWNFGFHALLVVLVTVISSVFFEWLYDRLMHKKNTITDFSAVVTGLLLALNMPPQIPLWMPVLGSAFAIIVVKQLFGGLGQNFMNPALAGRCFLMISFAAKMTDFSVSDSYRGVLDTVTGATPLAALKKQGFVAASSIPVKDLFIGNIQGTIGETSALAILIGAVILLAFKVIDLKVPLTYIGSFTVFVIFYMLGSGMGFDGNYLLSHLFGGGLMLGAWFMATDYVTTPITPKGQLIYGCCLGILTAIFRLFGGSAEGVSYAIIFCNLLVPIIEKVTKPVAFGKGGKKA